MAGLEPSCIESTGSEFTSNSSARMVNFVSICLTQSSEILSDAVKICELKIYLDLKIFSVLSKVR